MRKIVPSGKINVKKKSLVKNQSLYKKSKTKSMRRRRKK